MYEILEKLCKERGIKITALCTKVTKSSGNLSTWKKGYMRSDYLVACADILNVSTDLILGRISHNLGLNSDELTLLETFRALPDDLRTEMLKYSEFLTQRAEQDAAKKEAVSL